MSTWKQLISSAVASDMEWGWLPAHVGPILRVDNEYYAVPRCPLPEEEDAQDRFVPHSKLPVGTGCWHYERDSPGDEGTYEGSSSLRRVKDYDGESFLCLPESTALFLWGDCPEDGTYVVKFAELSMDVGAIHSQLNPNPKPQPKENQMSKVASSLRSTVAGVTTGAKRGAQFTVGRTFVKKCRAKGLVLPLAEDIDVNVETALYAVVVKTAAEIVGIPKAAQVAGVSRTILEESVSRIISDGMLGDLFEDLAGLAESE